MTSREANVWRRSWNRKSLSFAASHAASQLELMLSLRTPAGEGNTSLDSFGCCFQRVIASRASALSGTCAFVDLELPPLTVRNLLARTCDQVK